MKKIIVYLTENEKEFIEAAADRERRSVSQFCLLASLEAARKHPDIYKGDKKIGAVCGGNNESDHN